MTLSKPISASTINSRRLAALWCLALGCLTGGGACAPVDEFDIDPPRVLAVEPAGSLVEADAVLRVLFSEPLRKNTIDADPVSDAVTIVLAPADEVDEAFVADLDHPGLSATRQPLAVPVDAKLVDDGATLEVTPRAILPAGTRLSLLVSSVVRDAAGNALIGPAGTKAGFRWDFQTVDGAPTVTSTDLPAAGLVVPNRKRVRVAFSAPVQITDATAIRIEGTPAVAIEAVLQSNDRRSATIVIDDAASGCARLGLSSTYALVVDDAVLSDGGKHLTAFRQEFSTGPACDDTDNALVGALTAIAAETFADLRFETTRVSTTQVRFGLADGALDCLGQPCPIEAPDGALPAGQPPTSVHTARVSGLTLGVRYRVVVLAEDELGNVARAETTVQTADLPDVAVNEILANPAGTGTDAAGEFIELANWGSVAVPIEGWTLRITNTSTNRANECTLSGSTVQPGDLLVVAGTGFDAAEAGVDAGQVNAGLCASLTNDVTLRVDLLDDTGRPVSTMGAFTAGRDGRSVERTSPDATDAAESYCLSRTDTGPTPGADNGVMLRGCDP